MAVNARSIGAGSGNFNANKQGGLDASAKGTARAAQWSNEQMCSEIQRLFKCPSDPAPDFLTGFSSGIEQRAITSYLAVASGNCDDYRNLEWDPMWTTEQQVRSLRSGVIIPTQKADPTIGAGMPALLTRVRAKDVSDGLSTTLMFGETIFDLSPMAGTSTWYNSDHFVLGSPQIDSAGNDLSEHVGSTFAEFNLYHHLSDADILALTTGQRYAAARQIAAGFGSWHAGDGVNFAFADGSTKYLSSAIDQTLRTNLGMRNDGAVVGPLD